jgi:hypothetical protein
VQFDGSYFDPSIKHYRLLPRLPRERLADALAQPTVSDLAIAAAGANHHALSIPSPRHLCSLSERQSLYDLAQHVGIFATVTNALPTPFTSPKHRLLKFQASPGFFDGGTSPNGAVSLHKPAGFHSISGEWLRWSTVPSLLAAQLPTVPSASSRRSTSERDLPVFHVRFYANEMCQNCGGADTRRAE